MLSKFKPLRAGALNQWASHFQTDLPQFWFNKKITAVGGAWVKNGVVRLDNNDGYTQLGYMNQWASHLQTDLPKFWINKQIKVIGDIVTTGDVHAEGTLHAMAIDIGSDRRLKKDVQPFEYGLDEVMQMNPLTYDYNGKGGTKSGRYNVGLFAQDLQEIAPEFVTEFTHQETEAETGKVKSEKDYLQIYDTGIKYMLVNATKEQQEIIDNQAAKIETLEETLAELKATVAALVDKQTNEINHQNIRLQDNTNSLKQNQPNPFSDNTLIKYNLQKDATNAVITIYNTTGQVMHQERITQAGAGEIQLQADSLKAGTYSYTLTVDGRIVDTKQMVITK